MIPLPFIDSCMWIDLIAQILHVISQEERRSKTKTRRTETKTGTEIKIQTEKTSKREREQNGKIERGIVRVTVT